MSAYDAIIDRHLGPLIVRLEAAELAERASRDREAEAAAQAAHEARMEAGEGRAEERRAWANAWAERNVFQGRA